MQICNGPCFLKVIIRNTTVDTRSTVFHIRENLSNLEAKMLEVRYNIDAFNQYVTSQVEQLAARLLQHQRAGAQVPAAPQPDLVESVKPTGGRWQQEAASAWQHNCGEKHACRHGQRATAAQHET